MLRRFGWVALVTVSGLIGLGLGVAASLLLVFAGLSAAGRYQATARLIVDLDNMPWSTSDKMDEVSNEIRSDMLRYIEDKQFLNSAQTAMESRYPRQNASARVQRGMGVDVTSTSKHAATVILTCRDDDAAFATAAVTAARELCVKHLRSGKALAYILAEADEYNRNQKADPNSWEKGLTGLTLLANVARGVDKSIADSSQSVSVAETSTRPVLVATILDGIVSAGACLTGIGLAFGARSLVRRRRMAATKPVARRQDMPVLTISESDLAGQ